MQTQAITGCCSGLVFAKSRTVTLILIVSHIDKLWLVRLPETLDTVLKLVIKAVNFIKSSALNNRLLEALWYELNIDKQTFFTKVH